MTFIRACVECESVWLSKRQLRRAWFECESACYLPWLTDWIRMVLTPARKIPYCPDCGAFFAWVRP